MRRLSIGIVALAIVAVSGASAASNLSSVGLPAGTTFWSVEASGGSLLLSGTARTGDGCAWVSVDPRSLRLGAVAHAPCERPVRAAHRFVPVIFRDPRSFAVRVRIARVERGRPPSYGPVVMRFEESSDTHLEWAYGPGSLWLFDTAAARGAEVLRISTATGRVVRSVRMPRIFRPLLAADADGLWLGIATNGGWPRSGAALIYHVSPSARMPALVRRGGRAALWLVAGGHRVWVDVVSGTSRQVIWRLDGSHGRALSLGRPVGLSSAAAAFDARRSTVWLTSDVPANRRFDSCVAERIVTLDGKTGATARVVDIRLPSGRCLYAEPGSTAFAFGAFYAIDTQSQPNRLFRVVQ